MAEYDELLKQLGDNIDARKNADVNLAGGATGTDALTLTDRAEDMTTTDEVSRDLRSRQAAVGLGIRASRAWIDNDPNFKLSDHWDSLKKDVPIDRWEEFSSVESIVEAEMLKAQILQETEDKQLLAAAGSSGLVSGALTGIIDIDAPLMFISGGTYLGGKVTAGAAKVGIDGTKTANVAKYAAAGLEAGVVTETANVLSRPTGEWTDIPAAGLGGLVFGGTVGSLTKAEIAANKAASNLRKDFAESHADGQTKRTDFTDNTTFDDGLFEFRAKDSVGAASTNRQGTDEDLLNENVKLMREKAQQFNASVGIANQMEFAFPNTVLGRAARKLQEAISKSPIASDWDRLMNSKSSIAAALAYKAFESPAGIVRNNKSAAIMHNIYQSQIAAPVNTKYRALFNEWADPATRGKTSKIFAQHDPVLQTKFHSEVMEELQYRYHDGTSKPGVHPAVLKMADAIDEASSKAVGILKGRSHETAVRGSENLKPESGWFPQRWRGDKINALIKDGVRRSDIEIALKNSYMKMYPAWDEDIAKKFAKAVVRRAAAKERGIDTNLARMLDQEGKDFMEEFLVDNGMSKHDAERLIDGLKGIKADQNKENILKQRRDVDLREPIPNSKYRIMDLIDSDIIPTWTKYSRQAAGASSLARHGIHKADKKDIINAIKIEEEANGGRTLPDDFLESMFTYFEGGAFAGGLNPWVRRSLQTTNLSLLNSLGLTQAAETGVSVAAVGFDAFRNTAPKELKALLSGKDSPVMDDLRGLTAFVDGEHRIYMDHLALDEMRKDPGHFTELGNFLDKLLIRGSRIQGYASGFYKVKQLQQRIAVRSMLYRLADNFSGKKVMNPERLYDIGLDEKTAARVGKYFTDGTVELDKKGGVLRMNFDKWRPDDVDDIAAALNRHAYQVVQQAQRGEGTYWFHKDAGALLSHLKSFTMLTMQKQLVRNARIMDAEASMAFVYSMLTAGTVYTVGQAIKGNTQNLDAEHIMKGAFMLSNMTGFIPQWSDPVMSMLGMDNLRFNHYGAMGVGGDVIGIPPALTQVNRIAHIPEAAVGVATGNYRNEDIQALQATPIIGNLYGFSYMFNAMKDNGNRAK